jgi:hypothetical protein
MCFEESVSFKALTSTISQTADPKHSCIMKGGIVSEAQIFVFQYLFSGKAAVYLEWMQLA